MKNVFVIIALTFLISACASMSNQMLGIIVEKLSKDRLENQIKIRVLDRSNLKNTSFPNIPTYTGKYIHSYMFKGDIFEDWSEKMDLSWAWAAGGMISNISDIKKYIKAIGDGTLLSKDLQQERFKDCIKGDLNSLLKNSPTQI